MSMNIKAYFLNSRRTFKKIFFYNLQKQIFKFLSYIKTYFDKNLSQIQYLWKYCVNCQCIFHLEDFIMIYVFYQNYIGSFLMLVYVIL